MTAEYRKQFRLEGIPKHYSALLHALINFLALAITGALAILRIKDLQSIELLMIPFGLLLGNFTVYMVHKYALHRTWFKFGYEAHTLRHHRFYTYDTYVYDEPRDFFMIFFPPSVVIAFALFYIGPVSWLLPKLIPNNLVQLFIFMSALYFALYEIVHLISHLRDDNLLTQLPGLKYMRTFHRKHHDPKVMSRANFGIVFPFMDWILKTHIKG